MDISLVIKHRLKELGLDQRDLAAAAQVTESYISQLLARKKSPPAPGRTDIYEKLGNFLRLPAGELARLAELQRKEDLKKKTADPSQPLFKAFRELVLRKSKPGARLELREIFEKEPFGALERLVTQALLGVAKQVARERMESREWLRLAASLTGHSDEQMRVAILDLLDTDVFNVTVETCVAFLEPLIERWEIDLETFQMEVVLNAQLAPGPPRRFAFTERLPREHAGAEPGLMEFLKDPMLSSGATVEEIEFLKDLRFYDGRRPLPLFYYRVLQALRDPLHFGSSPRPEDAPPLV